MGTPTTKLHLKNPIITNPLINLQESIMRTISTVLLVSTLVFAGPLIAGTGHEHTPGGGHAVGPISDATAIKRADAKVKSLVANGKLDKSWAGVKSTGATQKDFGKGVEWVVTYKNEKASEKDKQTLYVYYTLTGHYLAANFTGK